MHTDKTDMRHDWIPLQDLLEPSKTTAPHLPPAPTEVGAFAQHTIPTLPKFPPIGQSKDSLKATKTPSSHSLALMISAKQSFLVVSSFLLASQVQSFALRPSSAMKIVTDQPTLQYRRPFSKTALSFCTLPFCQRCPPADMPSYCGVVSNPDAAAASDDSDSESSLADSLQIQKPTGWRQKLLQMSNIASLLCVLDCTVLPIVTVILPLFGIVAASPAQMEWLHQAGHAVALGFVLPVGGMATVMNYLYAHRTLWIASLGWLGLALVVGANAGCSLVPHGVGGVLGHALHEALHYLHHGLQHRIANVFGCFLLLFSNYLSHKKQQAMGTCSHGPGCTHNH